MMRIHDNGADTDNTLWQQAEGPGLNAIVVGFWHLGYKDDRSHLRFGVSLSVLAGLFFGANLFSALSFLVASPLARRFGLLNTMVFTHLPSNLLLALVAFMPTFPLAAAFLLVRQMLSQMDVPTRQAYTMALVAPEARTTTASVTSLARSGGSAISPIIAGVLLQGPGMAVGLPLVLAGTIKVVYDLSLWAIFRRVTLAEE